MVKPYMNRADREHHLTILVTWERLCAWLAKTKCLTKNERKRIKTAATHLLRTSDSIISRMDKDYAMRLTKDACTSQVRITTRVRHFTEDLDGISTNDLYDLASYSLQECAGCDRGDWQECNRRKLYQRLGIPVAQDGKTGCPYQN